MYNLKLVFDICKHYGLGSRRELGTFSKYISKYPLLIKLIINVFKYILICDKLVYKKCGSIHIAEAEYDLNNFIVPKDFSAEGYSEAFYFMNEKYKDEVNIDGEYVYKDIKFSNVICGITGIDYFNLFEITDYDLINIDVPGNMFENPITLTQCECCYEDRSVYIKCVCGFIICSVCFNKIISNVIDKPICQKCKIVFNKEQIELAFGIKYTQQEFNKIVIRRALSLVKNNQMLVNNLLELYNITSNIIEIIGNSTYGDIDDVRHEYERLCLGINDEKFSIYYTHIFKIFKFDGLPLYFYNVIRGHDAKKEKPLTKFWPCPNSSCSGFIESYSDMCKACLSTVCKECHSIKKFAHRCDPVEVESVKAIIASTKNCPICHTIIYKIDGCDHMFCPKCNTPFNWSDGKITKRSSNPLFYRYMRDHNLQELPEPELRGVGGVGGVGDCENRLLTTWRRFVDNDVCGEIFGSLNRLLMEINTDAVVATGQDQYIYLLCIHYAKYLKTKDSGKFNKSVLKLSYKHEADDEIMELNISFKQLCIDVCNNNYRKLLGCMTLIKSEIHTLYGINIDIIDVEHMGINVDILSIYFSQLTGVDVPKVYITKLKYLIFKCFFDFFNEVKNLMEITFSQIRLVCEREKIKVRGLGPIKDDSFNIRTSIGITKSYDRTNELYSMLCSFISTHDYYITIE